MLIIKAMMVNAALPEALNQMLSTKPPRYHSYLLRFWEERSDEAAQAVWRFGLEDPVTVQRYSFANLEALMLWIKAQIETH